MSTNPWHECPDCRNQFTRPFVCVTCGAQKLYDNTVLSQAAEIEMLRPRLRVAVEALRFYESSYEPQVALVSHVARDALARIGPLPEDEL